MQQLHRQWGIKGIALSGRGQPEDIVASERAGFEAHLVKPVMLPDVTAAIAKVAGCNKSS
jgi:CheY-like chemotaxis protein